MNITEFLALKVGAEISQGAHKYRVIANHAGVVVAQRTVSLHTGDDWMLVDPPAPATVLSPCLERYYKMHEEFLAGDGLTICSKDGKKYRFRSQVFDTLEEGWNAMKKYVRPKIQEFPPRPTLFDMHQQVLAAGYKFVRKHIGEGWRYQSPSGWYYPTVEQAWETLPAVEQTPPRETLYSWSPTLEMMRDELYAAGWKFDKHDSLYWTTPNGVLAGNTRTSWKHLQKLRGKK